MKAFRTELSNSSMVTRYAFMSLMADATCTAMLFGSISLHVSEDKLAILIILFNILAIGGRVLFSSVADDVKNKHTGVRLAVMLIILGFVFPTDISIKAKVLLMAAGNSAFHAFASSSILSRSKFTATGIGLFTAGSTLGVALARYAPFFGYLSAAFLMMAASPSDKGEEIDEAYLNRKEKAPKTIFAPLFIVLLLLCSASFTFINNSLSFDWYYGRKTIFLAAAAAGVGRAIGGFMYDKISVFLTTASLGGGALLLACCPDSKKLSLVGILLLNMFVPTVISLVFRFMPKFPAFSYSIVSCFSYIGYVSVKILPQTEKIKALIMLVCGFLLLISFIAELVLYINGKKATTGSGEISDE